MDPPPPLPPLSATATTTAPAASMQQNYSDSIDSSPRSHNVDTNWDPDHPLPPVPGAPKLRLMCSYGGHIIPRPHDKSLCYVGGETRIVVVDRNSSLSDLSARLSRTLLNGRPFSLKYQLPNEDLDSLISVTTDEDLDNMIEEYDRSTSISPLKPSRLRLFLFLAKPETAASMGSLLDDAKSETWFVDALNNAGLLPRGISDSATMDCLLNLDQVRGSDSCNDLEAQGRIESDQLGDNNNNTNKQVLINSSMPDSPIILENSSSFGSSSSTPSMSNLPPIRVRVEDQKVSGAEEQFAQMNFALPPLPSVNLATSAGNMILSGGLSNSMAISSENTSRVFSDDERSDQGVPVGFRKPPLPLTLQNRGGGGGGGGGGIGGGGSGGGFSLPSPDSVASDSSIASASSLSKAMYYQDQVNNTAHRDIIPPPVSPNTASDISSQNPQKPIHQIQDSPNILPPQLDQHHQQQLQQQQQQFVHAGTHYIHHTGPGSIPIQSYYPMYHQPSQQQLHPHHHHQIDQQYPVYLMPITQSQPYNMSMQSSIQDPTIVTSATYKEGVAPQPIYPPKTSSPALVQVPSNQFPQQYVGYPQMNYPYQSIAVASSNTAANYGIEYSNAGHEQLYYSQHPASATPLPSQYQTMTQAVAVAAGLSSDPSNQDGSQQQIRTS